MCLRVVLSWAHSGTRHSCGCDNPLAWLSWLHLCACMMRMSWLCICLHLSFTCDTAAASEVSPAAATAGDTGNYKTLPPRIKPTKSPLIWQIIPVKYKSEKDRMIWTSWLSRYVTTHFYKSIFCKSTHFKACTVLTTGLGGGSGGINVWQKITNLTRAKNCSKNKFRQQTTNFPALHFTY